MPVSTSVAQGALFGAFIGDAAGATLDFLTHKPSVFEVKAAMKMVGGGIWRLAPGQITDDGELAMALLNGLTERQGFDVEKVAQNYFEWLKSPPFDLDKALSTAFSAGHTASKNNIAQKMQETAGHHNQWLKSNGSLMRCTPLAIWSTRLSQSQAIKAAQSDAQLSHPNPTCTHATAAYVLAIRHLCLNPKDSEGAFEVAHQYLKAQPSAAEVLNWMNAAAQNIKTPYVPDPTAIRIAFTHAFRQLKLKTSYEDAIRETLMGGGDCDSNACIVGGLIGAAQGIESIPPHMVQAIVDCDTSYGIPRPVQYHTRNLAHKINRLLA